MGQVSAQPCSTTCSPCQLSLSPAFPVKEVDAIKHFVSLPCVPSQVMRGEQSGTNSDFSGNSQWLFFGSSSPRRSLMEGPGQDGLQTWSAWGWCTPLQGVVRLLSPSSSDCSSTRNLCLFPTGFFISREMKTSRNSKCWKHHCRVCAIIILLRKLLKVLHSPMIYFAVRSTLWDLFISNKNPTEKKIWYFL